MGGPRTEGPNLRPATVRAAPRPRPLVARTDLVEPLRDRPSDRLSDGLPPRPSNRPAGRPRGRFRRFVARYGWRAYALPLLTAATLIALVDLALTTPEPGTPTAEAPPAPRAEPAEPSAFSAPPAEPLPTAPVQGDAGPSPTPQVLGAETYTEQGAGTVSVVDGSSVVYGSGPLSRFIVEVEDGIGVDGAAFASAVETTLSDARSWGGRGQTSFQRVGAAEAAADQYEFRVTLVSPANMERYCPGVGTGGYTSCRYGDRAVINLARWATAVPHYDGDIGTYRHYVVNHEVGHVLGNGHVDCPGPGQVAPVMLQQTLGLDGCVKNAWPYP